MKLRRGDKVQVIAGADKGKRGEIRQVWRKKGLVLVTGVNLYKKHLKGTQRQKGGVVERERPIACGKVGLVCPRCDKPTRKRICRLCQTGLEEPK